MKRLTEPELMEDETQVLAYANANFSVAHDHFITLIKGQLVAERMPETVLELGCGPGDITQRFAHAFPHCVIDAVDGSQPMLDSAQNMLPQHLRQRINFYRLLLPATQFPKPRYHVVFSNSLLHHLHDPYTLWESLKQVVCPGGRVFIMDLIRPHSISEAKQLVYDYASGEPEILKNDFYKSLLAAFSISEIHQQVQSVGLKLSVEQVTDRHVFITGKI
ncbi:MAG: class I SAM-dependent methyltransferase [Methylococcales bacterium]|nr:class I SAM-dependent methyltransferase [Methylococcales bacterium]